MDQKALTFAVVIGTVAQIAMVVAGHDVPSIKSSFMWGGLGFSLAAGLIYAWRAINGWRGALTGGTIAGAVCAAIGIALSYLMGDAPAQLILFGTIGSAVTGLIGGAVGKSLR